MEPSGRNGFSTPTRLHERVAGFPLNHRNGEIQWSPQIGTESSFEDLVKNLILLEHDAIAAYDSTIERLSDAGLAEQVRRFRDDHLQHLEGG